MAYQSLNSNTLFLPPVWTLSGTAMTAVTGIAATGEKVSFQGLIATPNRGSKSIRKVHLQLGTVVKAGGSALTLSLQDLSTSANNVPDETQDETVAIANATLASSTWITTGNLSADRAITHGTPLAVVVEFDGAGRLGADSVGFSIRSRSTAWGGGAGHLPDFKIKTGGSWSRPSNGYGNAALLFEFTDGTFGTFFGAAPINACSTIAFNNGSSPNEYALRWNQPYKCKIEGIMAGLQIASATASTLDCILYQGMTALATTTVTPRYFSATGSLEPFYIPLAETELAANTDYYFSIKATGASNLTMPYVDVAAAAYMAAMPGGANLHLATRAGGAWTHTTTRRPEIFVSISQIDDGAGVSGGGPLVGMGNALVA